MMLYLTSRHPIDRISRAAIGSVSLPGPKGRDKDISCGQLYHVHDCHSRSCTKPSELYVSSQLGFLQHRHDNAG